MPSKIQQPIPDLISLNSARSTTVGLGFDYSGMKAKTSYFPLVASSRAWLELGKALIKNRSPRAPA